MELRCQSALPQATPTAFAARPILFSFLTAQSLCSAKAVGVLAGLDMTYVGKEEIQRKGTKKFLKKPQRGEM
jgi:hypothetical protein